MYLDIFESVLDRMLSRIGLIYPPVVLTQGCRLESQQRAQPWEVGRSHGDTDNTQHSTFSSFFTISYFFKVTPTTLNILQLSFSHFLRLRFLSQSCLLVFSKCWNGKIRFLPFTQFSNLAEKHLAIAILGKQQKKLHLIYFLILNEITVSYPLMVSTCRVKYLFGLFEFCSSIYFDYLKVRLNRLSE